MDVRGLREGPFFFWRNMNSTGRKIRGYFVKFALTLGIQHVEAEESSKDLYVRIQGNNGMRFVARVGQEFFYDKAAAEAKARDMAKRKVATLQVQLKRMKELSETAQYKKVLQ